MKPKNGMKRKADALSDRFFDWLVAKLGLRSTLILLKTWAALFALMGCASAYSLWVKPSGRGWLILAVMVGIFLYNSGLRAGSAPDCKEQQKPGDDSPRWGR